MENTFYFLAIISVLVMVAYIQSRSDRPLEAPQKELCVLHQWERREQPDFEECSYLICKKCEKMPGWED